MRLKVSLGERSYYIYIGNNIFPKLKRMLPKGSGVVITDRNVNRYWGKEIKRLGLPVYVISPGEASKSLKMAERLYKMLLRYGLDRTSFLVAFGGGVVGDLVGFVAGTYMRGISYIQVPTTLMAMVDSSIGGKTGVNLSEGKNLVGCFWQPEFVFIDTRFLSTLPDKEIRNGLAEVIKYGVIKDRHLFEYLEKLRRTPNFSKNWGFSLISRCARIKAEVVSRDEREITGLRAILNYGHTIAHAIESSGRYKGITHGEAVGIGMMVAAKISNRLGYLSDRDTSRQIELIKKLVKPRRIFQFRGIKYDKKSVEGRLRFVLADRIGHVFVTDKVPEGLWQTLVLNW